MEVLAMERDAMWRALDEQRASVADLVASLPASAWAQPSLCAGWTVREVVAHLTLGPLVGVPTMLVEVVRAGGRFNRMVDATARRRAELPVARLVADLRGIVGSRRLAPGQKLADAVMDVLVHGQDIAIPLRLTHPMPLDAARASAEHLWRIGFPFHAGKRLRGFRLTATDVDWTAGAGAEVRGPIGALVPLLTGRIATLPDLAGAGLPELAARCGAWPVQGRVAEN